MILEAFAEYLRQSDPEAPATVILARWLWERLSMPPENNVDRVIHCEVSLNRSKGPGQSKLYWESGKGAPCYTFLANSESGDRLLRSLYEYALSYEHQKWARWLHVIKASDFNQRRT